MNAFIVRETSTLNNVAGDAASKESDAAAAALDAQAALQRAADAKALADAAEVKRRAQIDYIVDELNEYRENPSYVLGSGPRNDPTPEDNGTVSTSNLKSDPTSLSA